MKIINTFILALALSSTLLAQGIGDDMKSRERNEKMESRIESKKIAFITQKLDLSPKEAQKFWPIYNEYQSKMKDFRNQNKIDWGAEEIDDNNANAFLEKLINREQKELDIKREYFNNLKTAVSPKKIAQFYILEQKFRQEILKNIKNRIGKKKRKMRKSDF